MDKQVIARMNDAVLAAFVAHALDRRARCVGPIALRHVNLGRAEAKKRYMRARRRMLAQCQ
jgi:hypothetical protein